MTLTEEELNALVDSAPSLDSIRELQAEADRLEAIHRAAFRKLREAAAGRARILGWSSVAQEVGISPKMLHAWAKDIPGEDQSDHFVRRERARIRREERANARA